MAKGLGSARFFRSETLLKKKAKEAEFLNEWKFSNLYKGKTLMENIRIMEYVWQNVHDQKN